MLNQWIIASTISFFHFYFEITTKLATFLVIDGTVAKRLDQGIRANITGAY